MVRMVDCVKLGRTLPGLQQPPFPGPLGQRIFDHVSAEGYTLWQPHMTIMINHYALNPADPETRKLLRNEMEEFFFGENAGLPEGWAPPGSAPSKGAPEPPGSAPSKGAPEPPGAAPSKGAPAPQRK